MTKTHNDVRNYRLSRREAFKKFATGIGSIALSDVISASSLTPNPKSRNSGFSTGTCKINQIVDTYVEKVRKRAHIPGLSIGVMREGQPILLKGYGMANLEHGVPATEKTLYQLASITKQFTATGIMILFEEGKIKLEDKIHKHLSGLPTQWSDVTIRHLLTHTSGITSYTDDPKILEKLTLDITKDQVFDAVISYHDIRFAPGERWEYCNSGYVLLGRIIEEISGDDYGTFLKRRIFNPLKMLNTGVDDEKAILKGRSNGYVWESGTLTKAKVIDQTWALAAGDLISNVLDLAKWDRALYGDDILPQHRLREMWTPVRLNDGSAFPYGFAWNIENVSGHFGLSHSGAAFGYGSVIFRFPDDKLSVVVLLNEQCWIDPNPVHPAYLGGVTIAGLYEPELATRGKKAIKDQAPKITELAKVFLSKFMNSKPDEDLFSNEFWNRFSAWEFPYYVNFLQQAGLCQSITLVDRNKKGEDTTDLYQLNFPSGTFMLQLGINGNGKISDMRLMGEVLEFS